MLNRLSQKSTSIGSFEAMMTVRPRPNFSTSDWYQSDDKVIKPMVDAAAKKYAEEKKLTVRDCS